jgi:hypothetical protein
MGRGRRGGVERKERMREGKDLGEDFTVNRRGKCGGKAGSLLLAGMCVNCLPTWCFVISMYPLFLVN